HEFRFKYRSGFLDQAIQSGSHPDHRGVEFAGLALTDPEAGHALEPEAIEALGDEPKLNDQVAGQVRRPGVAPLFPPSLDQRRLVAAHDDPGVRSPNEVTAILQILFSIHHGLLLHVLYIINNHIDNIHQLEINRSSMEL